MKAILMAAGIGSRISREVSKPKTLLDIGNKTVIRNMVELLINKDIEVIVVLGYKDELVKKELEGLNVIYFYNPFFRITNSIASLWMAREVIDNNEDIILANADIFIEEEILNELINCKYEVVMLADYSRTKEGDYFFKCENKFVKKYGKDLEVSERSCEYVGITKISSQYVDKFIEDMNQMIKDEKYNLWWENILYEQSEKINILALDIQKYFWSEIDFIEDYKRILEYIETKK